jgi:60 kDa SS-A/Ro ribonucleoprotein
MVKFLKGFGPRAQATPQALPIPGSTQVPNSAGGYAWAVSEWTRLDRFLVLGSEGGSYYAAEHTLTHEHVQSAWACIEQDGLRVVERVVEISEAGRAPKNDPALLVLAMAAGLGDQQTRQAALAALPRVARIGTHLFHFLAFVQEFRGWGRALRAGVAGWYQAMPLERLTYQVVKYQQRDGWTHRDALRLAHPQTEDERRNAVYRWITQGWEGVGDEPHPDAALRTIWAFEQAKRAETAARIAQLVRDYGLPREAVPTRFLSSVEVWDALLQQMPMEAMVRNLATMTRVGLLTRDSSAEQLICERLHRQEAITRSRLHPVKLLAALMTYQSGKGARGSSTWTPVKSVVDALNDAFYLSFGNVEPAGKRLVLALDVSGSMSWGTVAGVPGLTPRVGAAALALVTAATERHYSITAFSHQIVPIKIAPNQRLDRVLKTTDKIPMGGTDCALPMLWALEQRIKADAFIILTDSETWYGKTHPAQALQQYRERMGIAAKLVVVGMVANRFSIADPNDAGMLDVIGFDTAAPQLISDFVAGRV